MKFNSWRESSANGCLPVPAGAPKRALPARRAAGPSTPMLDMMVALVIRQARAKGLYQG